MTPTAAWFWYRVLCHVTWMLHPDLKQFLLNCFDHIPSLLPVCGWSVSAFAAVMFILSATPPPLCLQYSGPCREFYFGGGGVTPVAFCGSCQKLALASKYTGFLFFPAEGLPETSISPWVYQIVLIITNWSPQSTMWCIWNMNYVDILAA